MTKQIVDRKVTEIPLPAEGIPLEDLAVGNFLERNGKRELIVETSPEIIRPNSVNLSTLRRGSRRYSYQKGRELNVIETVGYYGQLNNRIVTELHENSIAISYQSQAIFWEQEATTLREVGL